MSLSVKKWNDGVKLSYYSGSSTKWNTNRKSMKQENLFISLANIRTSPLSPGWRPSLGSPNKLESKQFWKWNGWWGDKSYPKSLRTSSKIFPQLRFFLLDNSTMSIFSPLKGNVMCSHTTNMSFWQILEILFISLGLSMTQKAAISHLRCRNGKKHATAILHLIQTWRTCNVISASCGFTKNVFKIRRTWNRKFSFAKTVVENPQRREANDYFCAFCNAFVNIKMMQEMHEKGKETFWQFG